MTIQDAIDELDEMMPNAIGRERKVKWLATLDGQAYNEVISTHWPAGHEPRPMMDARHDWKDPLSEGDVRKPPRLPVIPAQPFVPYNDATPMDKQLLIGAPYTDAYRFYLCAQVCLVNRELTEYNTYATMYNNEYEKWRAWYNRTHMPIAQVRGFML